MISDTIIWVIISVLPTSIKKNKAVYFDVKERYQEMKKASDESAQSALQKTYYMYYKKRNNHETRESIYQRRDSSPRH